MDVQESEDAGRVFRVVVAEDAYLVREGIKKLLAQEDEVEVVEFCASLRSLLQAVERHDPDVVVTDIRMPPGDHDEGIQAAAILHETRPQTGVVVVSQYAIPTYAISLFENGAARRAYLLKQNIRHRSHLVDAIREVASGGSVVDPVIVEVLVEAKTQSKDSPLAELTPRELAVLAGVARGKSNGAIAASLFLTKRAVEKYVNSIFAKLGLPPEDTNVSRRVVAALVFLSDTGAESMS